MATLVTKNSSTAAAVPGTGDLVQGELAVNVTDKRLFTKNAGGSVVEVGTNPSSLVVTGDVGIGTTSPAQRLDVVTTSATVAKFTRDLATDVSLTIGADNDGAIIGTDGVNVMRMFTGGSERARITSAGDLLVGTTGNANNYKTHILTTGAGAAIGIFQNNATTPYGINVYYGSASPNNSNANTSFLYCNDLTTLRIQLASNGGIINYQANNSNLSDRREKTDFAPAKSYLDTICAIPVQTFKYIDQTDDAPTLGVVAQDVQAVAPELVMESNWGTEDNPKMRLSIYETDLQYALMKCIQEQQALITDLRARVAALETA